MGRGGETRDEWGFGGGGVTRFVLELVIRVWSHPWVTRQRPSALPVRALRALVLSSNLNCRPFPLLSFSSSWLPHPPHHPHLSLVTSSTSSHLLPLPPFTQPTTPSSKSFKHPSVPTVLISESTHPILLWSILSNH